MAARDLRPSRRLRHHRSSRRPGGPRTSDEGGVRIGSRAARGDRSDRIEQRHRLRPGPVVVLDVLAARRAGCARGDVRHRAHRAEHDGPASRPTGAHRPFRSSRPEKRPLRRRQDGGRRGGAGGGPDVAGRRRGRDRMGENERRRLPPDRAREYPRRSRRIPARWPAPWKSSTA
jgi:hypothetical protein